MATPSKTDQKPWSLEKLSLNEAPEAPVLPGVAPGSWVEAGNSGSPPAWAVICATNASLVACRLSSPVVLPPTLQVMAANARREITRMNAREPEGVRSDLNILLLKEEYAGGDDHTIGQD